VESSAQACTPLLLLAATPKEIVSGVMCTTHVSESLPSIATSSASVGSDERGGSLRGCVRFGRARGRDARESCLGEPMVPLNRMCFLDQCFLDQVQESAAGHKEFFTPKRINFGF